MFAMHQLERFRESHVALPHPICDYGRRTVRQPIKQCTDTRPPCASALSMNAFVSAKSERILILELSSMEFTRYVNWSGKRGGRS